MSAAISLPPAATKSKPDEEAADLARSLRRFADDVERNATPEKKARARRALAAWRGLTVALGREALRAELVAGVAFYGTVLARDPESAEQRADDAATMLAATIERLDEGVGSALRDDEHDELAACILAWARQPKRARKGESKWAPLARLWSAVSGDPCNADVLKASFSQQRSRR